MDMLTWIQDNWDVLLEALGALYVLASIYVRLTPSPEDDAWLRGLAERASFLQPKDGRGVFSLPGAAPKRQSEPDEHLTGRRR